MRTCLSHEVLHDAVEGENMATGCDLGTQGVRLQGDGALYLATCHHHHLPPSKTRRTQQKSLLVAVLAWLA